MYLYILQYYSIYVLESPQKQKHVHSSIIHKSKKVEKTDEWINKTGIAMQ